MIFTQPCKWEKIAVLGHSNEGNEGSGELTFDAEIRIRAASHLIKNFNAKKICLLGGGNDKISGPAEAEVMAKYLSEKFSIERESIENYPQGINTLDNISGFILSNRNVNQARIAYLTSDYNVARLKLILEIFGQKDSFVLSAEKILLMANDEIVTQIQAYLSSQEYQNNLEYESYWTAKTIYDDNYSQRERKALGISQNPIYYFKNEPRREMKKLEEK